MKGNHKYSRVIFSTVDHRRKIIASNHNSIRITANKDWENNGLSYVMTVSSIQLNEANQFDYQDLNSVEQRNLLIMLEPGIVHQEDSLLIEDHNERQS